MSENKPNDEPKLSTTDRVIKCEYEARQAKMARGVVLCCLFVCVHKINILMYAKHIFTLQRSGESSVNGLVNGPVAYLGGEKQGVSRLER